MKSIVCTIITLALTATLGCQPSASQRLAGQWQGRPESQSDKQEQSAEKQVDNAKHILKTERAHQTTLLEKHEFTIDLDLRSDHTLEMSLQGKQSLIGSWQVLDTISPQEVRLEIVARPPAEETKSERRRFLVTFLPNDNGFTLREEGTDPLFGAIYFQRKS